MEYILMHKEVPVIGLTIDEMGYIKSLETAYNTSHIPVGIAVRKNVVDRAELNKWWMSRAIPASRMGIRDVLETLDIVTTAELLSKAYGLSLSDGYWIKPKNSDLEWSKINFFDNDFSEDMGNILFGEAKKSNNISLLSPDNTSDGWLKKKWKIIDGKRYLIKSGSGTTQQEPYNEVIATIICRRLGINHIPYTLTMINDYPYSACENFITKDTEFVSAYDLMKSEKKENHISTYRHYINVATENGIDDIEERVNEMLVLDYIVGNEDRHQGNFGIIRNSETLEYIGSAPIFDTGNSLWFDKPIPMIKSNGKIKARPFKSNHEEQIKLVTSFDCFDIDKLNGLEDDILKVFNDSVFIDEKRADVICKSLRERIIRLQEISENHEILDDVSEDLTEDIRYSGDEDEWER